MHENTEHIIDDPSELWIMRDTGRLKQELRDECEDVVRARREVLGIEVPLTEDELAKSIGIQHLLTPKTKKAAREQHIHNIISKQDVSNPEALSIIAMYSSKQNRMVSVHMSWPSIMRTSFSRVCIWASN